MERKDGENGERRPWYEGFTAELDPERLDASLEALRERLREAWNAGRYTRVRLSYKGRPLLPDIPLGLLLATEAVAFWWAGPLRALVVNLGAKALVEVQFVHRASEKVEEARQAYLDGELERAEDAFREALRMRPGDPSALYGLGVLLKVRGQLDEARQCFERAAAAGEHPDARRAAEALEKLDR